MTERFKVVALDRARSHAGRHPRRRGLRARRRGRASFSVMQQGKGPLVLYLFDVLEIDGEPIVASRCASGASASRKSSTSRERSGSRRPSTTTRALLEAAKEQGLEGIVSKKVESRYQPGKRTREWLKVRRQAARSFSSPGTRRGRVGGRSASGSLVLAVREGKSSTSATSADTEDEIDRLLAQLRPLERDTPRRGCRRSRGAQGRHRVGRGGSVAEVKFAEWTHDGRLRRPRTSRRRPTCIARNRSPARSARASGR